MKIYSLNISDLKIIEIDHYVDNRGFFCESYNKENFDKLLNRNIDFIQDNFSCSKKNVLRGLHYQKKPFEQAKLIQVLKGKVFDVAVDIRPNSKTFGKYVGVELSESDNKLFFIPEGFAHGFLSLSNDTCLMYKVNNQYSKEHEVSIHWHNNSFNIEWPLNDNLVIQSKKDSEA